VVGLTELDRRDYLPHFYRWLDAEHIEIGALFREESDASLNRTIKEEWKSVRDRIAVSAEELTLTDPDGTARTFRRLK
jgi:hypothetical protein